MKRIITEQTVRSPRIPGHVRFAVASDIHSSPYEDVLDTFAQCDAVLIPGSTFAVFFTEAMKNGNGCRQEPASVT